MTTEMHPFERVLSVSTEDIELELRGITEISWANFWLNPRKLRGSDFLIRWSQGVWSERPQLIPAFIEDKNGHILPYVKFEGGSLTIADAAIKV